MKNNNNLGIRRKTIHSRQHNRFCHRLLPALIASCFACGYVSANPMGPTFNGPATASFTGLGTNSLTITNKPNAIINWQSFSIGCDDITTFIQAPTSRVLNRVTGVNGQIEPSEILGTLRSGQYNGAQFIPGGTVYLINPNEIMFGPNSQVNVGGLVASSLNMTDPDFLAGKNTFNGSGSAGLVKVLSSTDEDNLSQGRITAANGGKIYLIAPNVTNTGILTAPNGEIVLAGGHSVMLADENNPNLRVVISAPLETAVNLGQIIADAGKIGIYGGLLNLAGGTIQADSAVTGPHGEIILKSSQSSLNLKGTISAENGTLVLNASTGNSGTANITQTDPFNAANLSAVATNGNINLTNNGNVFSTISAQAGGPGNIELTNPWDITVGTVNSLAGITSTGPVTLTSGGSINTAPGATITGTALTLNAFANIGSSGAGNSLLTNVGVLDVQQANDVYVSNRGTGELMIPEILASRVVSVDTAGPLTLPPGNGITNFTGSSISLISGGNLLINDGNILSAADGTGPINLYAGYTQGEEPKSNGSNSNLTTLNQNGTLQGASVNLFANDFGNFKGTYTPVNIPEANYVYPDVILTVDDTTVRTKVYDGLTDATLTGGILPGVPDGISLTLNQSGFFDSKKAGINNVTATDTVTVTGVPFRFRLIEPTGLVGTITPKPLTINGTTATDKIYDGNNIDPLIAGSLAGLVQGDAVILTQAGTFANKNVGTGLPVTVTNNISGNDAGNYSLAPLDPLFNKLSASITPAPLTVTGGAAQSKIADGTTVATVTGGTLVGVIPADSASVGLIQAGNFITPNVGKNIPVIVSDGLSGTEAGNYIITKIVEPAGGFSANILPAVIGPLPEPNYYSGLDKNDKAKGEIKNEADNSISCS